MIATVETNWKKGLRGLIEQEEGKGVIGSAQNVAGSPVIFDIITGWSKKLAVIHH